MLLICSTTYSKDDISSQFLYRGSQRIELNIDEIKSINNKLIELECYKKELDLYKHLTSNLRIINDSLTLDLNNVIVENKKLKSDNTKQRNLKKVFMCSTGGLILLLIIAV